MSRMDSYEKKKRNVMGCQVSGTLFSIKDNLEMQRFGETY